jgi:GNAT superfamily N-acetyltransferase
MIRRIRSEDASLARDVRLRALRTDPLSFGSTYEREVVRDDAFWAESARRHAESEACAIFLAFAGDAAIGIVRGAVDETRGGVCFVHAMWVAPEARGGGVGAALLATVEAWMVARGGAVAELSVTDAAPSARRMYERAGYRPDGHSERNEHGVIEHRLRKPLKTAPAS